jgi:tetratricopeptide (TPR) repeat protein
MADPPPDADRLERLMSAYRGALAGGRTQDAEAAMMEFLALIQRQAADEPTPESALRDEAAGCEAAGDWAGAEAAYRRMLARAEADGDACALFRAHEQLSGLHGLLGQHGPALDEARAAVAAARGVDLPTLLFMALDGQARCALRVGRVPEALAAASEVLDRVEGGALYDLPRGRALALRAACRVAEGDLTNAERYLEASWAALQPQAAMAMAAGVHSALGWWWAVTARPCAARDDVAGAVQGWQEAIARGRYVVALPHVGGPYAQSALARALHGLGQAHAAGGRADRAAEAHAESQSLRQALGLAPFGPAEPTL